MNHLIVTQAKEKKKTKKVAASMVWWLVISFYQVPVALYPNEDGLLAPGICVDGTYHDKVPGEPIGSSVPFKQCLSSIYVP